MRETTVEKHLIKTVKGLGGMCAKVVSPGMRGFPDRLVILPAGSALPEHWPGQFFVETKAPNGKLSEVQKRAQARIRKAGGSVYTVCTKERVDELFSI